MTGLDLDPVARRPGHRRVPDGVFSVGDTQAAQLRAQTGQAGLDVDRMDRVVCHPRNV